MLWTTVFLVALAFGQVPAKSVNSEISDVIGADFFENVAGSDGSSRIVSGWEAQAGQFPHQVYLRMVAASGQLGGCGGSIVHRQWILTAAHCTAQRVDGTVVAGAVRSSQGTYVYSTSIWFNHPTYVDAMVNVVQPNDVSLMFLAAPITFSDTLKPIRVQSRLDAYRNYNGEVLVASGYGRTWTGGAASDQLMWVYLRGLANADCSAVFGSIITANSICARFFNVTSQSTCHGDSGGPLMLLGADGQHTLVGVTSFVAGEAHGGCHSGHPAGFIRPGPFHSWFTSVTGHDFENLEESTTTTTTTPQPPIETTPTTTEPPIVITPTTPEPTTPTETTTEDDSTCTNLPETTPTEPTPPESEEESGSSESGSDEDPEISELLKKLEVKVKVKVNLSKYGVNKEIHHNHTISHHHKH